METIKLELEYPVIFLDDGENTDIIVPEHNDNQIVAYNELNISVHTISYIDGEVELSITNLGLDEEIQHTMYLVEKDILLRSYSGKLVLGTPGGDDLLIIKASSVNHVSVWVDSLQLPEKVIFVVIPQSCQ